MRARRRRSRRGEDMNLLLPTNSAALSSSPIDSLLRRCEADARVHMSNGGSSEEDVLLLERSLGRTLPDPFRLFLRRLGGGVFYLKHEIFGPRRVMIHDIELVPDLLSF